MSTIQTDQSLVDLLDKSLATYQQRVALVSMGSSITYARLDEWSAHWAGWLQSLQLPKDARIAIMLPNVIASPVTLIGTLRAGHVVVNVNPLYTPRELEAQLLDSRPDVLVVFESFAATVQRVPKDVRPLHIVVVAPGDLLGGLKCMLVNCVARHVQRKVPTWQIDGALMFSTIMSHHQSAQKFIKPCIEPDDLAFLQYTGGTTGEPRAAMLSHRNVVANILQVDEIAQPAIGDLLPRPLTMLTALPLYHVFAMTVCELYPLYRGMRVVLVINPRDLKALTKVWQQTAPNIFPAVNTLFAALLRYEPFTQLDFSELRIALGGGMAVQASVAAQWQKVTGRTIIEGYGMSETSPVICANPTDAAQFSATVGWPLPGTDVVILDDDGQPVPDEQLGEIAVRGPQVMKGYWAADSHTMSSVINPDGYLLTGDIGIKTIDGQIRIVDRKKDLILVSGFNVYPAEIDAVFSRHPDVADCAAVGVPDKQSGEAVRLYVQPSRPGVDPYALNQWARDYLTGYKRPREILLVDELPKNTVGKTLRRVLRDRA